MKHSALLLLVATMVAITSTTIIGQNSNIDTVIEETIQQTQEEAISEIIPVEPTTPPQVGTADAEGVIPSITHKGEILDLLKVLSYTADKNIIPSREVRGTISVNLFRVTFKEALDAILPANGFAYIEEGPFIKIYTQKEYDAIIASQRKLETQTFQLNYIPAVDAVTMITPLLSASAQISTSPTTTSEDADNWAGSNYIVLVDYPEHLEMAAKLIKSIDVRPSQVLIEATILAVKLDDTNELGINFNALGGVDFQSTNGNVNSVPIGDVALSGTHNSVNMDFAANVTSGGVSVGVVKNNIGFFISALESITDTVTLGNPKVLTLNRQSGEVNVGREDGFISSTESTASASTSSVEMLKTGTILKFTPFVMNDGFIRMELHPESSEGQVTLIGNFALPYKTTSEVTTNVLVKDGHTIVIGGLFRESTISTKSQIPVLGDLPLIGPLCRSTSDKTVKEEIIFLITPHIVDDTYAETSKKVLDDCNKLLLGAREGILPTSREYISEYHYQHAKELQAQGNLEDALWHANRAWQIRPYHLDTINLRDELVQNRAFDSEVGSVHTYMSELVGSQKN